MLERQTVIIGDQEFAFGSIPTFEKAALFLKIQRVVTSGLSGIEKQKDKDGKDIPMDGMDLFAAILPNITDQELDNLVVPMFAKAQLASVTDNKKIDSKAAINQCIPDIDVLFELIFEVGKYNFLYSLKSLASRFGLKGGILSQTESTTAK